MGCWFHSQFQPVPRLSTYLQQTHTTQRAPCAGLHYGCPGQKYVIAAKCFMPRDIHMQMSLSTSPKTLPHLQWLAWTCWSLQQPSGRLSLLSVFPRFMAASIPSSQGSYLLTSPVTALLSAAHWLAYPHNIHALQLLAPQDVPLWPNGLTPVWTVVWHWHFVPHIYTRL